MILLSELSSQMELAVVAYTYNLSTREAEDQEFKGSLVHTGFCNGDGEWMSTYTIAQASLTPVPGV